MEDRRDVETMLRKLLDYSANGIVRLRWFENEEKGGKELRCIYANSAAGRYLLTDLDILVGETSTEVMLHASLEMDRSDSDALIDRFMQAVTNRESLDTIIPVFGDPTNKWLRMIVEPLSTDVVITLVDITDTKIREDALNNEIIELKERLRKLEKIQL